MNQQKQRWEYQVLRFSPLREEVEQVFILNDAGGAGWELVSVVRMPEGGRGSGVQEQVLAYFKRVLTDGL
jgi:hypothetical protein